MSHVNQWGLYNWFDEHGLELVYPADVDAFRKFGAQARVFYCTSEDADYITLQYHTFNSGSFHFRVKPDLFVPISPPLNRVGQQVFARKGSNLVEATISDINWHFLREKPIYGLIINGKRAKKWYWDEDITPE